MGKCSSHIPGRKQMAHSKILTEKDLMKLFTVTKVSNKQYEVPRVWEHQEVVTTCRQRET